MIKVASIAVSSLFIPQQQPKPGIKLPREQNKIRVDQSAEVCLKPRADLPPEILEFCSSFNPSTFSLEAGGGVGCYIPPINDDQVQ